MAWTKITTPSKTTDSPVDYEATNTLIADAKTAHDTFTAKHDTSGNHDDDLLPKGRGRITYSGSTPTLAQNWGIVSSVAGVSNGVRVTISTESSATTGIHVSISSNQSSDAFYYTVNSTTTIDIFFTDTVSEAAVYPTSFTFAVWID